MEKKSTVWKKLFLSTLSLSMFTFGGGYVIISLMKTKFVDQLHWINEDEMLDMTAIAQSSPGAIAVNGGTGGDSSSDDDSVPDIAVLRRVYLQFCSGGAAERDGVRDRRSHCFCRLGYGCGSGETEELFFRIYYDREFSCLYGVEGECHLDYSGGCGGRSDPDAVV